MKKEYPDILKLEGEKWHNPDPATGKLGTRVPAEWLQTTEDSLKSLTLEMLEVLKSAGINPNELNNTQVRDAIRKILLNNSTSTLSDRTDQTATIKAVNDVNRAASTAQKTANNAYALAQTKQDKLTFVGDGPEVMKKGAGGLINSVVVRDIDIADISLYKSGFESFYVVRAINRPVENDGVLWSSFNPEKTYGTVLYSATTGRIFQRKLIAGEWEDWQELYTTQNTTIDKSGFVRASGNANALSEFDRTNIYGSSKTLVATQYLVTETAQKATNAHYRADEAYSLANKKQDKLTFVGDGPEVMKKGAGGLINSVVVRDIDIADISLYKSGFESFYVVRAINRPVENDGVLWSSFNPEKTYGTVLYSATTGRIFQRKLIAGEWEDWQELYTTQNTTIDKSGFVRAFGSKDAMTTDMLPPSTLFFFDTKTVPSGFLELAGQAISKEKYPILYAEFGSKLPNRRDRYFRAAGGTRAGAPGTLQDDAIRNIVGSFWNLVSSGTHPEIGMGSTSGVFRKLFKEDDATHKPAAIERIDGDDGIEFRASNVVPTANENRPYSISVLACVRAQ